MQRLAGKQTVAVVMTTRDKHLIKMEKKMLQPYYLMAIRHVFNLFVADISISGLLISANYISDKRQCNVCNVITLGYFFILHC